MRRDTRCIALFIGDGPFSKKLQRIFTEEVARIEAPAPNIRVLGRGGDISAVSWDLAFVVTPPQAHVDVLPKLWTEPRISSAVLRPIWVEKPFCSSGVDAHQLVSAARRAVFNPTFVDFTHLMDPLVEVIAHRFDGREKKPKMRLSTRMHHLPYQPRSYMTPEWDWGAHSEAMAQRLGATLDEGELVWPTPEPLYRVEVDPPAVLSTAWNPDGKGLQRGMREMLRYVYGTPAAMIEHPNWNLRFAADVTARLEQRFGACTRA